MKTLGSLILALAFAATAACGSDKDNSVESNKAAEPAKVAAKVDVCKKANECIEALLVADPEREKAYRGIKKQLTNAKGPERDGVCRQVLEGARYNPKAPADCK